MPYRPPRHEAVPRSPLRHHEPPQAKRPSSHAQGYDRRWAKLAKMFRRQHPLCADPFGEHAKEGRIAPGGHVDHIIPKRRGGDDDWNNLQNLCPRCHSRKTATENGGFGNPMHRNA